ncbi:MAG: outer membrane protein assembly factor BamA [Acidobacteriaceae bacterium]|nr:outer membrane protein assembly factor BamA [Acidobacteriaceae bacterium]MBV9780925.1 outer membrane protein assembly factor BamA [Acidobacteriaceae bacterium]
MIQYRPKSLHPLGSPAFLIAILCLISSLAASGFEQQNPPPQNPPSQRTPPQQQNPPQQNPQQQNPFENVPQGPEKPTQPSKIQEAKPAVVGENIIEAIEFRGQHRVPQDTLRALIYTKKGDVYDEDAIHRDFIALWNTGRFDDLRIEKEKGPQGGIILRFFVTERRTVHTIDYTGNKSITKSEILDRFKDRKVQLSPESQFDPGKVQRAKNVLQEYEAERGHQYATVTPQIRQVPPGGVDITFAIDEGPKVKVGHIFIQGNNAFSSKAVIRAMKNLKPIGIPHSILFENLFARTYDSTKLDEDSERIRQFYQSHGYFMARVINHSEKIYDVYGKGIKIPLINPKKPGKRVDITMVVSEGDQYFLRNFNFVGMKLFRTPDLIARQVFGMAPGAVFSTEKLQKGLDNLKKLYGDFGYIDFVPSPDPEPVPGQDQIDLTIDVDEGHQFFVRRIDFQGNTTTRDRVIRRELLIDEGDLFSNRLWETSILRINQLGYFDPLKAEDAAEIKRDTKTNTVDLLLKVHERGKNSIQLNGGVSGISGSFIGFSYSTNNFLGLGETLSLASQIGTILSSVSFGFTEPYLFDKPIQAGFTIYYQRYRYDQAQQESILAGQPLGGYFAAIGTQNLLNYVSNGRGFTTFASYQLRRSFARVGLTYGYNIQTLTPLTTAATAYFGFLDFEGVGGPNALRSNTCALTFTTSALPSGCNTLSGIRTSTITPSYAYNTVDHPIIPTRGLRLNVSAGFSGSVIGGNVNTLQPVLDVAYFRRGIWRRNVMGFHFNARFITGYGGKVAPPYSRYYMGGEDDIRGFDLLTISPIGYVPSSANIPVLNNDGTQRVQQVVGPKGAIGTIAVTQTVPVYQFITPGGDTASFFNYEYRIPIIGPVTLAPFVDAGVDRLSLASQLGLNPARVEQLNALFPQADFSRRAVIAPGTQKPRVSSGIELQVLMPVVNAPFRVYWAYNLSYVNTNLTPPIAVNPSMFPNEATYQNLFNSPILRPYFGVIPYDERRSIFRFSIGRTF